MLSWNPELYHKFQNERFAPFQDLMNLVVVRQGISAIDLGCGTGELTQMISDILPGSSILGIDSSDDMLEKAVSKTRPGLKFESGSIENVEGKWDLVFSNAAIQWVDNHCELVPKLLSLLKPGGQIAVQMPANHNHPTQKSIVEVAAQEPYRNALSGWQREWSVLSIRDYAELLYKSGAQDINVFEKIYPHVLDDVDAIVQWLSGTALLPYFERLPMDLHNDFTADYKKRLSTLYPETPVFFPYQRIFFSARIDE